MVAPQATDCGMREFAVAEQSGGDAYDDGTATRFAYHYCDANNAGRETLDIRRITFSKSWPTGAPLS